MTGQGESPRKTLVLTKSNIFPVITITKLATWNVRTLFQCGKLAQVVREFHTYGLNILGVSEMRWIGSGKLTSEGKTVVFSGHNKQHIHGVGFVLDHEANQALVGWKPISDRIITARFHSRHGKTSIVQVYAPTEEAEESEKDLFYDQLQDTLNGIPKHDLQLLMGDFNAQIDGNRAGWSDILGPFGVASKTNNNGHRLLTICSTNELCIGNTFFNHKRIHKQTWKSPNGKTTSEIDYICICRRWRSALQDVRSCRGADVASDHYLVKGSLKLKLKKIIKHSGTKPYDLIKLKDQKIVKMFHKDLSTRFQAVQVKDDIEEQWKQFREIVTTAADQTLGRRRGTRRESWIRPQTWALIDQRRKIKHQRESAKSSDEYWKIEKQYEQAHKVVKKSCRDDKKFWTETLCADAQKAMNRNDTRALFGIIRHLTKTGKSSSVPIKDKTGKTLLTEEEQNMRWYEHFKEILNQPEPYELPTFEDEDGPTMEVDMGDITTEEISSALKKLKNNKAAGLDQISAEMLKNGGNALIAQLTKLCNLCWKMQTVPSDWKKGVIVKLPKKGNLGICGNWRGITLLSVPGKVFCCVLLHRLKTSLDEKLREEQAGFRYNRSCCDQIFVLRNIVEQCLAFQKPLFVNFIDFRKAFDSVHRNTVWQVLQKYGVPLRFIDTFKNIYEGSSCCVKVQSGNTEFFRINTSVRQGCVLSPLLFITTIDYVMRKAMNYPKFGISWTNHKRLTDLDFADDIALLAESMTDLQEMTNSFAKNAATAGLSINSDKTKLLRVGGETQSNVHLTINGIEPINNITSFTYLGSVFTTDADVEADINARIGKAASAFRRLKTVWSSSKVSKLVKIKLYQSIVMPTVLYASETWKMTVKLKKHINAFHQRCLRRILNITYKDHITNDEVYHISGTKPLCTIMSTRRFCGTCVTHVRRTGSKNRYELDTAREKKKR
uniref:Craniofacial development protein 2-like n=1 Tax=Phallusia mammillata TaxID=59560 RepID=A0A6F9D8K7_9ASCI|nr:craniofacial development protein 2-like [Phallusia mammillata]